MAARRVVFIRTSPDLEVTAIAGTEPWSSLPLSTRRELYRIGTEAGWSRRRVRTAYAANKPIGVTRYYRQRARAVVSGRLTPVRRGRAYGEYAPRSQARIDRLAWQYGLGSKEARQELRQGTWKPFARKPYQRIPQTARAEVANRGVDASQDSPNLRIKRDRAVAEAYNFAARQAAEGNIEANGQTLAARLSMSSERQLDMWLAADDADKIELARTQYTPAIDAPTLQTRQRVNPVTGVAEYYHPITGKQTDLTYVHDNFAWYH
jgi:hypothetical protein